MISSAFRHVLVLTLAAWCVLGPSVGAQNRGANGGRGTPVTSPRLYVFDGGVLESDPGRYRLTKEDVDTHDSFEWTAARAGAPSLASPAAA